MTFDAFGVNDTNELPNPQLIVKFALDLKQSIASLMAGLSLPSAHIHSSDLKIVQYHHNIPIRTMEIWCQALLTILIHIKKALRMLQINDSSSTNASTQISGEGK